MLAQKALSVVPWSSLVIACKGLAQGRQEAAWLDLLGLRLRALLRPEPPAGP